MPTVRQVQPARPDQRVQSDRQGPTVRREPPAQSGRREPLALQVRPDRQVLTVSLVSQR